ncbi:unnamed protein product [Ectocarpus sp. CCAP 1310/34]|nr:unnamed protein product [Ectocarpus sp. CCAP 1310/34]
MSRVFVLLCFLLPAGVHSFLGHPQVVIGSRTESGSDITQQAPSAAWTQAATPPQPPTRYCTELRMTSSKSKRSKKAKTATAGPTATATVSRDEDLAGFLRWAGEEIGVKAPKLKGSFVDGLRGLVATQNIAKNDEMVVVPSESALVTTTDQLCPFPEWVSKEFWASSPWQVRLALLLLREKQKGAGSELEPWISRLPESFGTPVSWSAAELLELQYPHLEVVAKEQREEWKGYYSSLMASSPGCGVAEEELSWAIGVAYSRAFRRYSGPYEGRGPKERLAEVAFVSALAGGSLALGLGTPDQVANGAFAVLLSIPLRDFFMTKLVQLKRYALTPVVDLINHQSGIDSDVSYNYFYGYFAVTTQRGWTAGEQVFISYGPRSNDHLLQRYGFVEQDNPNDVYRITGLIDKLSDVLGKESVRVLRESGGKLGTTGDNAEGGPVESVTVGRSGLLGEEEARVMPVLRLAVVNDDQLPEGKAARISLKDFSNEISPANEAAARDALRKLCIKEREGFASTLAEDEAYLSSLGNSLGAQKRVAFSFRMEKKRVLDAAIASIGTTGGGGIRDN